MSNLQYLDIKLLSEGFRQEILTSSYFAEWAPRRRAQTALRGCRGARVIADAWAFHATPRFERSGKKRAMGKIRCTIDPKILPKTRIFHEVDEMSVRPATPEPSGAARHRAH